MAETIDRYFLEPRQLLSASKVDFYDAINLVLYAKLPLITALRGRELIAGYVRRDESGVVSQLMHFRGQSELLGKYATWLDRLSYPIKPSEYEPLLDRMCGAKEYALPYFFHEHHLMVDRRRRAALFARLYKELQAYVGKGELTLQLTDSERTIMLLSGAWMKNKTLHAYLELCGVSPWWEDEANLVSHARVERVLLSDSLIDRPNTARPDQSNETAAPLSVLNFGSRFQAGVHQPAIQVIEGAQRPQVLDLVVPQKASLVNPAGIYPPIGYLTTGHLTAPVSVESRIDGVESGTQGVETPLKMCFEWEIRPGDLKISGNLPPAHPIPEVPQKPINATLNFKIPATPPEEESYDVRQLPSFLLAEKLLKQSRLRPSVQHVQPTSYMFQGFSPTPIGVGASHASAPLTITNTGALATSVDRVATSTPRLKRPLETDYTPSPVPNPDADSFTHSAKHQPPDDQPPKSFPASVANDANWSKAEVAGELGVSEGTVDNYRKKFADFPKEIPLDSTTLRWKKSEIQSWVDSRRKPK